MLKKIMIAASLAALIGSPVMAQSYDPETGSGNIVPNTGGEGSGVAGMSNDASSSYAYTNEQPTLRDYHYTDHSWDRD